MCLYHFYLPQTYRSCLKEYQNQHSHLNSFRMVFLSIFWSQLSFSKFLNCRVSNSGKHNQPLFFYMLNCSMLNLLSNVFVAFLNQKRAHQLYFDLLNFCIFALLFDPTMRYQKNNDTLDGMF